MGDMNNERCKGARRNDNPSVFPGKCLSASAIIVARSFKSSSACAESVRRLRNWTSLSDVLVSCRHCDEKIFISHSPICESLKFVWEIRVWIRRKREILHAGKVQSGNQKVSSNAWKRLWPFIMYQHTQEAEGGITTLIVKGSCIR